MAGFAIQLDLILSRPDIVMGVTKDGKSSPPGYLETTLLEQFVTRENVECRGVSGEVCLKYLHIVQRSHLSCQQHTSDQVIQNKITSTYVLWFFCGLEVFDFCCKTNVILCKICLVCDKVGYSFHFSTQLLH